MDPRVEAIVALIELVHRLGVDVGPAKGERDIHLGEGGNLRGKAPDDKAPGDHPGRAAPPAGSPTSRAPKASAAGGPSLVQDLGVPEGAARFQEAALRLQSLPGRERDLEKLVKNHCALHESQKSLQLAIQDLSGKVDVLARTIPSALDSITSTQRNLGKNLSYLGRQLSSMESTLNRFHALTNTAGQPDVAGLASAPGGSKPSLGRNRADLYPNVARGLIFD